ncbi:SWIM zinc finger family protein [Paenibacillus thalictri]|uniref:SWIM-type domain-containing protein n=1 Tax=Paenibacillus thalictri TaxID=2527873 RepID=A0A4Q9DJS4_9BACL|nr:SWIM zinc finger family protein [Paenibacillus thalictri]TBL71241.1 hypothetical protein EYB31_31210 [Paenibacillus thalictri]
MSFSSALNDDTWPMLLKQVAAAFNEVTLSRGFNYFKQQRVVNLNTSGERVIEALVTGSEDYKVKLRLDQLASSSCNCPVQSCCKHMVAVLMELADRLGYPASQIMNARHYLKRMAAAPASGADLQQLPEMDVSGWHRFLDQYAASTTSSYDLKIVTDTLRHQLQAVDFGSVPFSESDRLIFELHQELFILQKIKRLSKQNGFQYYVSFSLYRVYGDIQAWAKRSSALFDFTLSENRLRQTLSLVRSLMAEETEHKYMDFGLYAMFWQYWITPQRKTAYWAALETDEIEQTAPGSISPSLAAAIAFLKLHQSGSEAAWEALETGDVLKQAPAHLFLPFFKQLADAHDWDALADWLFKTAKFFYGPGKNDLDTYMGFWRETVSQLPEAEKVMWTVLEDMLPHSLSLIEDMLYEQRKWKLWLELQIVQEHDPFHHKVSVLQPIEKEAPELLRPYYHQAIEHYVALKNRRDYKSAVKLLKRLYKVYKKLKQEERWERFFSGFTERHSRLRALQEELKKGKLLE